MRRRTLTLMVCGLVAATLAAAALFQIWPEPAVLARFEVPPLREKVLVSADFEPTLGRLVVVARGAAETDTGVVTAVDPRRGAIVFAQGIAGMPTAVAVDAQRGHVLVTSVPTGDAGQRGRLTIFSVATGERITEVDTSPGPAALAVLASRGESIVLSRGTPASAGSLSVHAPDGTVVSQIPLGVYPSSLAIDDARGLVFVANQLSNTVSIVELGDRRVRHTMVVGQAPGTLAHIGLGAGRELLVTLSYPPRYSRDQPSEGEVRIFSASTFDLSRAVTLSDPQVLRIAPDSAVAVVASAEGITGLSLPRGDIAWSRQLQGGAGLIADAGGGGLLVARRRGGAVDLVDARDGRTLCAFGLASAPAVIAVDARGRRAFAVATGGSVVAIDLKC